MDIEKLEAIAKTLGWGAALWALRHFGYGDDQQATAKQGIAPVAHVEKSDNVKDAAKDAMAAVNDASDDILDDDGSGSKTDEISPVEEKEEKDGS